MSDKVWKQRERKIAALFGTKRTPLSGSNSGHNTNSDSLHEEIYLEQKHRAKHAVWTLFREVRDYARREHKIPIVTLSEKGAKGFLVVVHTDDLHKLVDYLHDQWEGEEE